MDFSEDEWGNIIHFLLPQCGKYPCLLEMVKKIENERYEVMDSILDWDTELKELEKTFKKNHLVRGEINQLKSISKDLQLGISARTHVNFTIDSLKNKKNLPSRKRHTAIKKEKAQ